jgi:hypothetical protein
MRYCGKPDGFEIRRGTYNILTEDTPNHAEFVPYVLKREIQIHVRSTKSQQSLLAMFPSELPINIRKAATLRGALQGSIAPSEEHNVGDRLILDEANPGEGPMVICVGKTMIDLQVINRTTSSRIRTDQSMRPHKRASR